MLFQDERQTLLSERNKKFSARLFFRDWTIPVIMFIQISFLVFAWTFAGFMMDETIPLSDSKAIWIQKNSSDAQLIVTLASTILALIGSSLLGKVVQFALVRRLSYRPLRFQTMVAWTKLAQRSIYPCSNARLSWTLLSIAWVSVSGLLTTAWSTLLAPENVFIYYSTQGNETDFLNPALFDILPTKDLLPPTLGFNLTPVVNGALSEIFSDLVSQGGLVDAGFSAALAKTRTTVNYPTINFVSIPSSSYTSNTSTGGIYPVVETTTSPENAFLDVGNPLYRGLSRGVNVTQQGFTANITCRTPEPNDPVNIPILINSNQIGVDSDFFWSLDTYSWTVNCSSEAEYSTQGVSTIDISGQQNGLLMASVCFGQGFSGPSNQSFLVLLSAPLNSSYSYLNQTCEVTPLVTTVQTTYDPTGVIYITQPPLCQYRLPNPTNQAGELLWIPAFAIWSAFVDSQGLGENRLGNNLYLPTIEPPVGLMMTEGFLGGMMEYIGSYMGGLARLSANSGTTFNVTVTVHTLGWKFHLRSHGPSLAVITLVTIFTIVAGIFAVLPTDGYDDAGQQRELQGTSPSWFNPTEMMDILLASSSGDLARTLSESNGDRGDGDIGNNSSAHDGYGVDSHLEVVLGKTDKGRPALRTIHMDVTGPPADLKRRGWFKCIS